MEKSRFHLTRNNNENTILTEQSRAEQSRAEQSRAEQSRLYYVDNIKGIFIFLVVFGHLLAGSVYVSQMNALGVVHYFIYASHMPIFILLSGYLGKKKQTVKQVIYKLIIPYICFDLIYALCLAANGNISGLNILIPSFVYWYILCIAIMRLLTSFLKKRQLIIFAIICIIISCVCAVFPLDNLYWRILSLGRVFLLFPLYLVGYFLDFEKVYLFIKKKICIFFIPIVIVIEIILLATGIINVSWATHDQPINLQEYIFKLVYMGLAVLFFFGLSCIITKKECFLTKWGKNSLIVYLVHPFFVLVMQRVLNGFGIANIYVLLTASFVAALVITLILSMDCIMHLYKRVMDFISKTLRLTEV